ncbi:unnamed protein product [Urochloa decumbens]|uniref:DUF1618 domain-containing protein n=1 Tax=Urochloa decumbens TaxID=240449 RepID=A0ABC8Y6A7_9POAL
MCCDVAMQEALMASSKLISPFGSLGDVTNISRQPASIILDKYARIGKRMNKGTIATVKSSDGHILEVSLWTLEPPALSYFCINCHRAPDSEPNDADFEDKPHMVAAEGQFLLLRTSFVSSFGDHEYFMYKAGNSETGKLASLDQIPIPGFHLPRASEFGIVPHGHDDQYILAALSAGFDPLYYKLHLYFSKDKKWRSTLLKNPCPYLNKVMASKVVTLGEGIIAWVDFQHGMLVCNVHEMNPSPRYIPLPDPLPGNKDELQEFSTGPSKSAYRDLACTNGVIKFVEIEHHVATPKNIKVHDSDLIMSRRCKEPKLLESWNGWKAVMWTRTVSSDAWDMGPVIDAADIMFDNPMDLLLLSVLKGEADVDKFAFKDLYSAFPTLSTDGDDILYLHTMTKLSDPDARMVALDLGTKRVKAVGRYSLADHWPSVKAFGPCTVPCMTTGKVSASACVSIKRAHSSAHDPNKTSICVGHLSSSESGNKRPRLLAEKVNHGHNRAQNIIQNDHISPVRRAQSNLSPQQCFVEHYTPLYHHRNDQYFNWQDGYCHPGYASPS